jgi:hypothetical protein
MFVVSLFNFFLGGDALISNNILCGVMSGVIFSTDQSVMGLPNLEVPVLILSSYWQLLIGQYIYLSCNDLMVRDERKDTWRPYTGCCYQYMLVYHKRFLVHLDQRSRWTIAITWRPSSVVCCLSSVNCSHFKLLLRNHWADWNQT